ncbi:LOW QUALITY PROTEIN: cytosolic sulfotransferase 17 [Oryza brachyantha]|nr:LOW QUALITY PROTEIN: cytosolic sulfotransferase 17 [Oryza brachyantha]
MSSSSVQTSPSHEAHAETDEELYKQVTELVSTWPSSEPMPFLPLYRHNKGWCCSLMPMVGAVVADARFAARPSDIIIATLPKSGTTWIKALLYATVNRREHPADAADHPFNSIGPHDCVKFLEYQLYTNNSVPDLDRLPDPRLFATHVPFTSLPSAAAASGCKVVYVCRDPKDNLVSLWHFANKFRAREGQEPMSAETIAEVFCRGVSPFGPYWDHVLGYWDAHVARPEQVLFFRYEEMKLDAAVHVRRLAEFVGLQFSAEEEEGGVVEAIVRLCSFDHMIGLEATKGGKTELVVGTVANSSFFRRGQVGDWENHLSPETARRIDAITEARFKGSGLCSVTGPRHMDASL